MSYTVDSTFTMYKKVRLICRDRNQISGCLWLGGKSETGRDTRENSGVMAMFCILIAV